MIEIGGKPMLWAHHEHFFMPGITEFIIALGYRAETSRSTS